MKALPAILALVPLSLAPICGAPAQAQAQPQPRSEATSCVPQRDLNFVCGLINVEDFVPVAGGRWLVGSSYKAGSVGFYLIDTTAKTAQAVSLSLAAVPDKSYAGCAAPDLKGLMTHGLDAVAGAGDSALLYAVNHGGRESVEVFRLHPAQAAAQWIGCAILPEGASGNAVAHLPHGAFAVTKFLDTRDAQSFQHLMSGERQGAVYLWKPGAGFSEVPGSRFAGDNGIVASADGRFLYVNAYGSSEIYRVPLSGHAGATSVKVDFHPDNLRWAPDGKIFVTGQFLTMQTLTPGSRHGWETALLDPRTMTTREVLREPGLAAFDDATSTVQVGSTLWFCTFRGDRVAYRAQ